MFTLGMGRWYVSGRVGCRGKGSCHMLLCKFDFCDFHFLQGKIKGPQEEGITTYFPEPRRRATDGSGGVSFSFNEGAFLSHLL